MPYLVLTQDEQDEIVVQFLHAQERDHFCHTINQQRYAEMLKGMPDPGQPFTARIQQLHDETVSRLIEVEHIINQTLPQLPKDGTVLAAAIDRVKTKAAIQSGLASANAQVDTTAYVPVSAGAVVKVTP